MIQPTPILPPINQPLRFNQSSISQPLTIVLQPIINVFHPIVNVLQPIANKQTIVLQPVLNKPLFFNQSSTSKPPCHNQSSTSKPPCFNQSPTSQRRSKRHLKLRLRNKRLFFFFIICSQWATNKTPKA